MWNLIYLNKRTQLFLMMNLTYSFFCEYLSDLIMSAYVLLCHNNVNFDLLLFLETIFMF